MKQDEIESESNWRRKNVIAAAAAALAEFGQQGEESSNNNRNEKHLYQLCTFLSFDSGLRRNMLTKTILETNIRKREIENETEGKDQTELTREGGNPGELRGRAPWGGLTSCLCVCMCVCVRACNKT